MQISWWPTRIVSIIGIAIVAGIAAYFAGWNEWRWGRIRAVWWLWWIFGISGGVALGLWLSPLLVSPQPPEIPLPNPLHDDATKWRLARNLHYLLSKIPEKCEAVIVRYQGPYSETYADDLKEVLTAIDWKYHEVFAGDELPRGLTLRSFEGGLSRACLDILKQRFNNDINPAPNPSWSWIETPTRYMIDCTGKCIEIDIGNDPKS
jgi:hypothetical protein